MEQDQDGFQDGFSRTPMSSSSSNVSGTQALKVTIEPEPAFEAAPSELPEVMTAPSEPLPMAVEDVGFSAEAEAAGHLPPLAEEAEPVVLAIVPAVDESFSAPLVVEPASVASEPLNVEPTPLLDIYGAEAPQNEPEPAVEAAPEAPPPHGLTIEELREAVRESVADNTARREQAAELIEEMSHTFGTMMDEARHDAALIGRKLMEFVRASFQNNVDLARDYAGARSVPEIVNVHTAYVRRQIELLSRQAEEFRALTSDIAAKKADKLQGRLKA